MSADPSELEIVRQAPPLAHPASLHAVKRAMDIGVSLFGLLALGPLMGCISLAILLERKGPILYKQTRNGLAGSTFEILKFRTLTAMDGDHDFKQVQQGDSRITALGGLLRRANLDELPQLVNVLRGDMSLVGPRPHPMALDNQFAPSIPNYFDRYSVRPGITGWAQVNSLRGPTSADGAMQRRVEYDLHYVQNFSVWFDIKILFLTLFSPSAFTNAY